MSCQDLQKEKSILTELAFHVVRPTQMTGVSIISIGAMTVMSILSESDDFFCAVDLLTVTWLCAIIGVLLLGISIPRHK